MRKKFRVLSILDTTMNITDQRVAVVELGEVRIKTIDSDDGEGGEYEFHSFSRIGDSYVIDLNSVLTRSMIQAAELEEDVELDMNDFSEKIEIRDGRRTKVYHHKSVYKP